MRIVIFSDTHGDISPCKAILSNVPADMIFHLGDTVSDAKRLSDSFPEIPVNFVFGNNDGYAPGLTRKVITIDGVTILLSHGHDLGVSYGVEKCAALAKKSGASLALFGHTHFPSDQMCLGVRCFCPGSVSRPRNSKASCGILEIENGKFGICHYDFWRV